MPERDPEIVAPGQGRRRESVEFVSQPAKLLRIASMIREVLQDVRQSSVDEPGRKRLREIYDRAVGELKEGLSEDLQHELGTLTIPLEGTPSESEIRIAQAQLVGWLEGLFQGIQAALWAQHMQARAQFDEMRRRGLPPGSPEQQSGDREPAQHLYGPLRSHHGSDHVRRGPAGGLTYSSVSASSASVAETRLRLTGRP